MREQTARDSKFPVACARCGGRISEPVAFCPHCGAHARFALAGSSAHAGSFGQAPNRHATTARVEPRAPAYNFEGDLDPPWPGPPTPLFASPDGDPYSEVRAPSARGWGVKAGTILVVAAFVVLFAGVVTVHRPDGAPPPLSQSGSSRAVGGTIGSPIQAQPSVPVAPVPQPRVAPKQTEPHSAIAPAQPQPAQLQTQAPSNGEDDSYANGRARSHTAHSADARESGEQAASAQQQYRSQWGEPQSRRAAAYRALSSAQAQLAKSDLRGARASLNKALAADPTNGEALGLREELLSREQERDASLSAARACVVQSRWNCVWHNAGKALAADASSAEASALVNRAIVESGAATAPAGPGPDNVDVPMVQ